MPSFFTPSSASLQHFLQTLSRLEEAFLLSPLSGLEQEGAVRRMRFAVDAGLKAMKRPSCGIRAPSRYATPPARPRRRVAEADHLRRAHLDGHARAQEPACEGRLAGNAPSRREGTGIPLSPRTRPPPGLACPASLFRGKKAMTKKAARPLDGASLFVGTSLPRSYTMIFSFAHFYYYYSGHQLLAPDRMCCA